MPAPNPGLKRLVPLFEAVRRYHKHRVVGLENVPRAGAAVLVHNHSLATYDHFLLGAAIFELYGRLVHGLGDRLWFRIPIVAQLMRYIGFVEASMAGARSILDQGEMVGVTPGGMREALKPSTQKYRLQWQDRKGFARLAILAQCPVVPVVCIGGDEIFTVYESPLTEMVYQRFKLPLPLFRGRGPTVVPRPAALTHYVESGLRPPLVRTDDPALPRAIDEYHAAVTARMNQLMQTVLAR
ncbi:MAG TPA: lysophospholipid acyltransferase family protein [Polyangia bacterium]|nr:lysophospholipid acyltransferase family protein [Polyangia bacterium]